MKGIYILNAPDGIELAERLKRECEDRGVTVTIHPPSRVQPATKDLDHIVLIPIITRGLLTDEIDMALAKFASTQVEEGKRGLVPVDGGAFREAPDFLRGIVPLRYPPHTIIDKNKPHPVDTLIEIYAIEVRSGDIESGI